MNFELLVASRYLRAKRKQTIISVITLIAILGVAAGVGALVVAMAVSEGQRQDIRKKLLGAQAHVAVYDAGTGGISNYRDVTGKIKTVEGVVGATPHIEQDMVLSSSNKFNGVRVIGIIPELDEQVFRLSENVTHGSLDDLKGNTIAIGKELAKRNGFKVGEQINIISPALSGGPFGFERKEISLKIVAIYSIGLFQHDALLVYVPFETATYLLDLPPDVATTIEVKVEDDLIDQSEVVGNAILDKLGSAFSFDDWKVSNANIFQALKRERLGMTIALSLIGFVACLNIVAMLTMMVLEKARNIATLMAMGATVAQIRRIFMLQGILIGCVGTALGLALGHGLSYFADKYQWIELPEDVYSIPYLPFKAEFSDSILIALAAIFISFLATLYPASSAAKVQPVEALRYE
jgi:lipoprotein-releasing system permease protein